WPAFLAHTKVRKMKDRLSYTISESIRPELARQIEDLQPVMERLFSELSGVAIRVANSKSSWHVASYDWKHRLIELNSTYFARDRHNTLPFVLAHETVHAVQWVTRLIPHGEKSADVYALSRLPSDLYPRKKAFYVRVPKRLLLAHAGLVKHSAERSIIKRSEGSRQYIVWFENELVRLNRDLEREK
ncbi:MAG: hypothetical protein JRN15_12535, partial [Nitrososphaerota archaeon]|nr:hypothetical protein [Nitrososphaerota archaeon]